MEYVAILVIVAVGAGLLIRNAMRNAHRQGMLDQERTAALLAEMQSEDDDS